MAYGVADYRYDPRMKVPHSWAVLQGKPFRHLPRPLASHRVLDVGCGKGYWANQLHQLGGKVVGVDASSEGIAHAKAEYPHIPFHQIPVTEDILGAIDQPPFDAVMSVEVVEHVYDPRGFARACFNALKPGGTAILTTPYHGYLKNLLLAVTGKMDRHFTALWDGGHIKFWSCRTLRQLMEETGFVDIRFDFAGRCPYVWMSMICIATKPTSTREGDLRHPPGTPANPPAHH